ncbi:HAD family acid phosphatase [Piscirickettsia litoralis]|uniref:HAD family acid phosphatase n=1 Tax=Piscirickettsia litoralis TaxID=1891921 RepID=UPI000B0EDA21|nr:HAD family acid phosphatase [Piscirickettsia litoralis]
MKTKLLALSLFTSLSTLSIAAQAVPLQNLDTLKQGIVKYHQSGQYDYDIARVIDQAQSYLSERVAENKASAHPKKLAIVLDIDETSLSNYNDLKKVRIWWHKFAARPS